MHLSVHGYAPLYRSELLHFYIPSRPQIGFKILMFPGQEFLRQNDMVIEPSGMLLHLSGIQCLEALGKVIPLSPSKLLWRLISSTVTENLLSHDVDGVGTSYVDGDTYGVCVYVCERARACVCSCKIVIMHVQFFPNLLCNMYATLCMPMIPVWGFWSEFLWFVLS